MNSYLLAFQDIDSSELALVGGKGANLGELSRLESIRVPAGFCITTAAFRRVIGEQAEVQALLQRLSRLRLADREALSQACAEIRAAIAAVAIPAELALEIEQALAGLGANQAYAVRSSATAEDLPTASFAGQQDTYLNVIGSASILAHISKCWASLFTERAVSYRLQQGFGHDQVQMAVVIQQMLFPEVSGIMFTADPVSGNRKLISIEASFGLGEALVSGLVSADCYKVREDEIVAQRIAAKEMAIYGLEAGGTETRQLGPERHKMQVLTDGRILELARIGRQIEAFFACPQDIEWCLADEIFYIVQSRPITTLYPIPEANDGENHVYLSVGHQQMMTDPMKPLGMSLFLSTSGASMHQAGGRLFVDCAAQLASPARRKMLLDIMGQGDPLTKDALETLIERGFIPTLADDPTAPGQRNHLEKLAQTDVLAQDDNPAIVRDLIERSQATIAELRQKIQTKTGPDLIDFILEDLEERKKSLHSLQGLGVIMGAMNASAWINEKMQEWLGEKNVADTLTLSVDHNITSEMGLALLDVADVIRPHPEVVAYLQATQSEDFLKELPGFEGGVEARAAILAFLERYGMRCPGEADITNTRWREKPTTLIPLLLSHIKNFEPHAHHRKFEQGRRTAAEKEQALLQRLRQLPDGQQKAEETQRMIRLVRNFSGYREYPKYSLISRYFIYKQALLKEAERLVQAQVIQEPEDIYYLSLEELREVLRSQQLEEGLISRRKDEYKAYAKLTPPRVMTSEGEILNGKFGSRETPAGALTGLPVSSGIVEGRARVVLRLEDARPEEGDILVTRFTDPGWTPLFVSVKGLVTEVGGVMTHGAVIAREYGLPAVVSVENATTRIKDGQRIRVHGTEGYVEILAEA